MLITCNECQRADGCPLRQRAGDYIEECKANRLQSILDSDFTVVVAGRELTNGCPEVGIEAIKQKVSPDNLHMVKELILIDADLQREFRLGGKNPMKQRISTDDLQQLTPEQQERLREWWKPEIGDVYFRLDYTFDIPLVVENEIGIQAIECTKYKNNSTPLLSIGQCIELLISHYDNLYHGNWVSMLDSFADNHDGNGELIDALFATVKEVL